MKKSRFVLGICFAALIAALVWWITRCPRVTEQSMAAPEQSQATNNAVMPPKQQANVESRRQVVEAIESALNAPITFYGKVIDQNGDPVPFARAAYGLLDKFNESGSNGHVDADANGFFTIQGVRGAAIGVNVSKSGYYQVHKVSDQYFAYGAGGDSMSRPPPQRDNPAVFTLQKMGTPEPLIASDVNIPLPRNGTPVDVDIATGRIVEAGTGDLQIQAWTDDANNTKRRYDWKCIIRVPGGGLVERRGEFSFEAPESGYLPSDELSFRADAEKWLPQASRDFFVKLANNRFARLRFEMIAGGDNFASIQSFLNPTSGSRNLEFDPTKDASAP